MSDELSVEQSLVVAHAKTIGRLMTVAGAIALAAILARLLGQEALTSAVYQKAPVRPVWSIFAALTVAHLFLARFLLYAMDDIREKDGSERLGREVVEKVRVEESIFLRGLIPRTQELRPGSRLVRMDSRDPTTWLSFGLALAVFAACVPWSVTADGLSWDGSTGSISVLSAIALLLITANWVVGGLWIVVLSQLGLPHEDQWALNRVALATWVDVRWRVELRTVQFLAIGIVVVMTPLVLITAF